MMTHFIFILDTTRKRHQIFVEVYIMVKLSEFMYIKKFDNTEWDPDEIDIGTGIYSLYYQRKLHVEFLLAEEVIVYAVHQKCDCVMICSSEE